MNKFRVACFQTTSSDIPEENVIMLEKIFSKVKAVATVMCWHSLEVLVPWLSPKQVHQRPGLFIQVFF